uniref:Uncharacterized protein n=1 Tax=Cyprinodon variegatus TaxID=28743 RepID=A0A3Q2D1X1_CYPVA
MKTVLLVSALIAGVIGSMSAIPVSYNAFCNSLWLFEMPCAKISATLIKQIEAFSPANGCDKCHYELVSTLPVLINANHTSPDGLQAENITFVLSPGTMGSGCHVSAQSLSQNFTSFAKDGVNYCNLYDLLTASNLTSSAGFTEMTNPWACPGFGLATCKS